MLPLSIVAAAVIPLLLIFDTATPEAVNALKVDPWNLHFKAGMEFMGSLILPMYIILVCTLLPQMEYRSNTWKQVFTSPQSLGNVFFSKFLTVHLLILVFFIAFNLFMALSALVVDAMVPTIGFLKQSVDWNKLIASNVQTYISVLAISAIQFWGGMRFKNFITPIAMGFGLLLSAAVLVIEIKWEHVDKFPFAYPILIILSKYESVTPHILWSSLGYTALVLGLAFVDFKVRHVRCSQ